MIRIAICDDDPEMRRQLRHYTTLLLQKHMDYVHMDTFSGGKELLDRLPPELDILLLDIDLEDCNGVEVARAIRARLPDVNIVFITNLPQFAVEGYKVRAFGYLIKPLSYEDFQLELQELLQRLADGNNQQLLLKCGSELVHLALRDIRFIETQSRHLLVHTVRGAFETSITLSQLEKKLSSHGFLRCHTAYLVNSAHIKTLAGSEFVMAGGERIPVSKHRRSKCIQELSRYWGIPCEWILGVSGAVRSVPGPGHL